MRHQWQVNNVATWLGGHHHRCAPKSRVASCVWIRPDWEPPQWVACMGSLLYMCPIVRRTDAVKNPQWPICLSSRADYGLINNRPSSGGPARVSGYVIIYAFGSINNSLSLLYLLLFESRGPWEKQTHSTRVLKLVFISGNYPTDNHNLTSGWKASTPAMATWTTTGGRYSKQTKLFYESTGLDIVATI